MTSVRNLENGTMFVKSLEMLKHTEAHVLQIPYTQNRLRYILQKLSAYPINYFKVGFDNGISRDLAKFTLLSLAAMILLIFLVKDLNANLKAQALILLLPAAFFVSMALTLFPMPSSLATYNVSEAHVSNVIHLVNKLKITSIAQLTTVMKNVSVFQESAKHRINALRAIMALLWSFGIYQFNELIKTPLPISGPAILPLSVYFFFVLGMYLLVDSYIKTSQIILKSLEFGLNECECILLNVYNPRPLKHRSDNNQFR